MTGGLIGRSHGGNLQISHCYTAGYQKAVQVAAGLLAQKNSMATVDHSYTAVTWLKADTEGNTETVRYSTLPKGNDTVNNLFFLNGGTDYSEGTKDEEKSWVGEKVSYTDLSSRQQMVNLSLIHILGIWESGFRNLTNSKKDINSVDDVQGLKIRTMENQVHIAFSVSYTHLDVYKRQVEMRYL